MGVLIEKCDMHIQKVVGGWNERISDNEDIVSICEQVKASKPHPVVWKALMTPTNHHTYQNMCMLYCKCVPFVTP